MRKWSSYHVTIVPLLSLKEKWLDEDPEKISVLKYVATLKGCLGQGEWLKEIFKNQIRKQNESMVRQKSKVKVFRTW